MDCLGGSDLLDLNGLEPLLAFFRVEADSVPFVQRAEAFGLDGGMVNENVSTIVALDETKAFRIAEPLDCTFRHTFLVLHENFERRASDGLLPDGGTGTTRGKCGRIQTSVDTAETMRGG